MLKRKLLFFFILMWVNLEWDLKVEVGKPWGVPKGAVCGLCQSCCLQEQGLLQAFCLEKKWSPAFLRSVACKKVVGGVPSAALLPFLHLLGKLCFVGRASGWPPSPAGSPSTEVFSPQPLVVLRLVVQKTAAGLLGEGPGCARRGQQDPGHGCSQWGPMGRRKHTGPSCWGALKALGSPSGLAGGQSLPAGERWAFIRQPASAPPSALLSAAGLDSILLH